MANNSTLVLLRNEIGGLETIDTAWDPDTRIWYDAMAAAGMRRTFPETAAFDVLVKAMKTLAPPLAARVGDVLTVLPNKTWGAQPLPEDYVNVALVAPTGTTDYTDVFADAFSKGQNVYVPEGDFAATANTVLVDLNRTLFGAGYATHIIGDLELSDSTRLANLRVTGETTTHDIAKLENCWLSHLTSQNSLHISHCTIGTFIISGSGSIVIVIGGRIDGDVEIYSGVNICFYGTTFATENVTLAADATVRRFGCIDLVEPTFSDPAIADKWKNVEDTLRTDVDTAQTTADDALADAAAAQSTGDTAANLAANTAAYAGVIDTKAINAGAAAATADEKAETALSNLDALTEVVRNVEDKADDAFDLAGAAGAAAATADGKAVAADAKAVSAKSTADTAANMAADVAAYAGTIDTKAISANNKADTNATNLAALTTDFNFATKNITDFVAGSIWNTSGVIASNASFKRTARYRTQKDAQFKVPAGQTGVVAQAVFWKADGTLLSTVQNQTGVITAPPNAYYVAFSVLNAATEIKVQGGFWSLQQQDANLLFEYVHSGNKEVNITSIDYATNTFTAPAHGLVNSTNAVLTSRVGLAIKASAGFVIPQNVTPLTSYPEAGYYVVNATTNTFQLSLTEGGAPLTLTNKATLDLSVWHIEQGPVHSVYFDVAENRIRTVVDGGILLGYSYYIGAQANGNVYARDGYAAVNAANITGVGFPTMQGKIEVFDSNLSGTATSSSKVAQIDVLRIAGTGGAVLGNQFRQSFFSRNQWSTSNIGIRNMLLQNGTAIRIYKN